MVTLKSSTKMFLHSRFDFFSFFRYLNFQLPNSICFGFAGKVSRHRLQRMPSSSTVCQPLMHGNTQIESDTASDLLNKMVDLLNRMEQRAEEDIAEAIRQAQEDREEAKRQA